MNKKSFGKKIATIFTAIACLALAVLIWLLVEYSMSRAEALAVLPLFNLPFRG